MITIEYLDSALSQLRAMKKQSEIEVYRCEGAIEALEGLKVYLERQTCQGDRATFQNAEHAFSVTGGCVECGGGFVHLFGVAR